MLPVNLWFGMAGVVFIWIIIWQIITKLLNKIKIRQYRGLSGWDNILHNGDEIIVLSHNMENIYLACGSDEKFRISYYGKGRDQLYLYPIEKFLSTGLGRPPKKYFELENRKIPANKFFIRFDNDKCKADVYTQIESRNEGCDEPLTRFTLLYLSHYGSGIKERIENYINVLAIAGIVLIIAMAVLAFKLIS